MDTGILVSVVVDYLLYSGCCEHVVGINLRQYLPTSVSDVDMVDGDTSFTLPPCPYFGPRLFSSFFFFWGSP
jgi:hypothetical protein